METLGTIPISENIKNCSKCKEPKNLKDYSRNKNSKDGRSSICKSCHNEYRKEWGIRNAEKLKAQAKYRRENVLTNETRYFYNLKYYTGVEKHLYRAIEEVQNSRCALCECEAPDNSFLCVDHCHETQYIRGLLCTNCNVNLGNIEYRNYPSSEGHVEYLNNPPAIVNGLVFKADGVRAFKRGIK